MPAGHFEGAWDRSLQIIPGFLHSLYGSSQVCGFCPLVKAVDVEHDDAAVRSDVAQHQSNGCIVVRLPHGTKGLRNHSLNRYWTWDGKPLLFGFLQFLLQRAKRVSQHRGLLGRAHAPLFSESEHHGSPPSVMGRPRHEDSRMLDITKPHARTVMI